MSAVLESAAVSQQTESNTTSLVQRLARFHLRLNSASFVVLMALYFGFVMNIPVTQRLIELASATGDATFAYFSPLLLSAAFAVIFSLFNIPYFRKPFFICLVISSAMASYATLKYGVMFDYTMIENVFETNSSEAASYFNLSSFLYALFFGIIPALLISRVQFKKEYSISIRLMQKLAVVFSAIAVIAIIYATSYKNYVSVGRNNSYLNKMITPAHIYNTAKYINNTYFADPLEYLTIGADAAPAAAANGKPSLLVLVLGETARSMNIGYNGYGRNTNPHTEGMGIISYRNVSSCGTATAHSVPCMFSNLNRSNYSRDRANSQDNALDIIARTGTRILWLENDNGDKGVASKVKKINIEPADHPDFCSDGYCLDEVMLKLFDSEINPDSKQNQLLAMHIIGSHGPTYWKRYPRQHERFAPSCNRSDIENCSDEAITNVYDNTIAYTDFILAQTIKRLQKYRDRYNVALMYISDHGESLGEGGLYLHGTPYALAPEQQTRVPWLLWMDSEYEKAYGINRECLQHNAESGSYSQDNFFHTLIDFAGVQTYAVNLNNSLIDECRN